MCGFEIYSCCIFAAVFGIIQSVLGLALSTFGLLLYYCVLKLSPEDTSYSRFFFPVYMEYFYSTKMCLDKGLSPPDVYEVLSNGSTGQLTSSDQVKFWMGGYVICNSVWLLASLLLFNGLKKRKVVCFYIWLVAAITISVVDLVATVIFSMDVEDKVESSEMVWKGEDTEVKVAWSLVVLPALFSRMVIVWVVNLVLICQVFRALRVIRQCRPLRQREEVMQRSHRSRSLMSKDDYSGRIPLHSVPDPGDRSLEQTSHYRSPDALRPQYRSSIPDIIPTDAFSGDPRRQQWESRNPQLPPEYIDIQDVNVPTESRGRYQDVEVSPELADRFQNPRGIPVQRGAEGDVFVPSSHQGRFINSDVQPKYKDNYQDMRYQDNRMQPDSKRMQNRQDANENLYLSLISDGKTAEQLSDIPLNASDPWYLSEDMATLHPTSGSSVQRNIPKRMAEIRHRGLVNNKGDYHRYSLSLDKADGRRKYHRLTSVPSNLDNQPESVLHSSQPRASISAGSSRPSSFSVEGDNFPGVEFRNKSRTQDPNLSSKKRSSLTSGSRPTSQELRKEFPWSYLQPSTPQSASRQYSVDPVFFHNPAMDIQEEDLNENHQHTNRHPQGVVPSSTQPVFHVSSPLNDPRPNVGYADPWDLRNKRRNESSSNRHRL